MGVLSTNLAQINSGGLISASFVSDLYNVLSGNTNETVIISSSLGVSGSINVENGITGSLLGTASTASYVETAVNATTASYIAGANVDGTVTTSVTASYALSGFQIATSTTLPTVVNGGLAVSSSGELYFGSASVWHKVTLG